VAKYSKPGQFVPFFGARPTFLGGLAKAGLTASVGFLDSEKSCSSDAVRTGNFGAFQGLGPQSRRTLPRLVAHPTGRSGTGGSATPAWRSAVFAGKSRGQKHPCSTDFLRGLPANAAAGTFAHHPPPQQKKPAFSSPPGILGTPGICRFKDHGGDGGGNGGRQKGQFGGRKLAAVPGKKVEGPGSGRAAGGPADSSQHPGSGGSVPEDFFGPVPARGGRRLSASEGGGQQAEPGVLHSAGTQLGPVNPSCPGSVPSIQQPTNNVRARPRSGGHTRCGGTVSKIWAGN